MKHARRAFTLVEVTLLLTLGAALLAPALAAARRGDSKTKCQMNLKQTLVAGMNYAVDFKDSLPTFWWTPDSPAPGDRPRADDLEAAARQGENIIRRSAKVPEFQAPAAWQPHAAWSTIVIASYMDVPLTDPMTVCPQDPVRSAWLKGEAGPKPPHEAWRYSSSYSLSPSAHTPGSFTPDGGLYKQGADHSVVEYRPGDQKSYRLKPRRLGEVMFPSQKVLWSEDIAWHTEGGPRFALDPAATPALGFVDGSVRVAQTSTAMAAAYTGPEGEQPAMVKYVPREFLGEPAAGKGLEFDGAFRWTKGGMSGRDFR